MRRQENERSGRRAIVIGSSDGIGLALSRRLVNEGWVVAGISRSPGRVDHVSYQHIVCDVSDPEYISTLNMVCDGIGTVNLCVYCAGIGEAFSPDDLGFETKVFAVNLMAAVTTVEVVATRMLNAGSGHIIGISSLSDQMVSGATPSYSASKAGLSSYLRGMALALRGRQVYVTNVRFGFVDTKMAKSPVKPGLLSVDAAVDILMRSVRTRPIQVSRPRRVAALSWVLGRVGMMRALVMSGRKGADS